MFGKALKIRSVFIRVRLPCLLFLIFLWRWQSLPRLNLQNGQLIKVTGCLAQEPQVFGSRQSFRIGQIQIKTALYPEFHYGEKLVVQGKVTVRPGRFFKDYLLDSPKIVLLEETTSPGLVGLAFDLREKLKSVFNRSLRKPLDGLLAGIVLGDKSLMSLSFWENLKKTGTLHLVVASGMNISFLSATTLPLLALFIRRKVALLILIILIWFYSILTGFQAPIIRASFMASLVYLAQILGREAESGRVLLVAGLLMVLASPLFLFDLGFQLSFLASAGLVYLVPKLREQPFFLFRRESFASTVAAQLATLPLLVGSFGTLNLISPLINLAVLWLIPGLLAGGMLAAILGLFSLTLGRVILFLFLPALVFLEQIINLSARLTVFQVELPTVSWVLVVVYYLWLVKYCWPKKSVSVS
jgi:competence protein ComEC